MKPAGYLTKYPDRLEGERGMFYDYVLASNGLFIEAEGKLLAARVLVAPCEVRGLAPLEEKVVLRYGKIPKTHFDLMLTEIVKNTHQERYMAVTYDGSYHITIPEQAADEKELGKGANEGHGRETAVSYLNPDSVMLDLHSHPEMSAFFSTKDNTDDQGFKLFGVVGMPKKGPRQIALRVGVYGYHSSIRWGDVFDGTPEGVIDVEDIQPEESEEEVSDEDELPHQLAGNVSELPHRGGWLRWDRWFRRRGPVSAAR